MGPIRLRAALASIPLCLAVTAVGAAAGAASPHRTPARRAVAVAAGGAAQFDLALTEVRYRVRRGTHPAARVPQLRLDGATGLNLVAAAVPLHQPHGARVGLVVVVNRRPAGSEAPDLVAIRILSTAPRSLGAPLLHRAADPFTRARGTRPALCGLPHVPPLKAGELALAFARGSTLAGFAPAQVIAEAYDVLCGEHYDQSFRQAVTQGHTSGCDGAPSPSPGLCCPPNAQCVPPCGCCGTAPCARPARRGVEYAQRAILCPQAQPRVCPY